MLSPQQIEDYRERGFLLVSSAVSAEDLALLRHVTERLLEEARFVRESDERFDIEAGHTPERPRVQRIKWPHLIDPVYTDILRRPAILEALKALLGPDIRLHGSKLNTKPGGIGAPVEWHQDWAFYPHTNDDILALGIYLDDVDESNGPLMVLPVSHKGPVYDHHGPAGFIGAIDPDASGIDFARAERLTGAAGSITLHHVRAVHGSDVNLSTRPRRLLLYELRAADAWPLAGVGKPWPGLPEFDALMLEGEPTLEPRLVPVPVRVPLPPAGDQSSIYAAQRGLARPFFGRADETAGAN